ncbi:MAG TPA: hypothetical protein VIO59_10390 [Rhodanobacter sp.]
MSQNLISLALDDATLAGIDAALDSLETAFIGLIALTPEQRRSLARMGDKSEAFCRQTLTVLAQNPQVLPPSYDLAEAQDDLRARDRLRPRLMRLMRLSERADDSDTALGSDVMSAALEGYALLRISGRNQGLESLRDALSSRFAGRRRTPAPMETPAT